MILEPVVEMTLGQDKKDPRQHQAAQEIGRWNDYRDRAGATESQQDNRSDHIEPGLEGEHPATLIATFQQVRRGPAFERERFASVLFVKRRRGTPHFPP